MAADKVALVVGAGDSLGGAVAKRFARAGYATCVARRHGDKLKGLCDAIEKDGGTVHPFGADARKEEVVKELIETIERDIGAIEVAVFNVGGNVRFDVLETTSRVYYKVWEMGAFGGFLVGREVAGRMVPRGRGTIIFTGATASVRGGPGYSAFAGAKHALRALAQSLARELGPQGIHVAHVVVDGPIDTPFVRENFPDMVKARPPDGLLNPTDMAENYLMLHDQPRDAWTHELDLRPWLEPW